MKIAKRVRGLTSARELKHSGGPAPEPSALTASVTSAPLKCTNTDYQRDQETQCAAKIRGISKRQIALAARDAVDARHLEHDRATERKWEATLSVRIDPGDPEFTKKDAMPKASDVKDMSLDWHVERLRQAEVNREWAWEPRPPNKFVRRKICRTWTSKPKDGKASTERRAGCIREERAFSLDPLVSRALFMAAECGDAAIAREFAKEFTVAATAQFRALIAPAILLTAPLHAKLANFHFQPSWTRWSDPVVNPGDANADADEKACVRLGRARRFVGMAVIGARRQANMKLDLDALTGIQDAEKGIERLVALSSENQYPLDLEFADWCDRWTNAALRRDTFAKLRTAFQNAKAEYERRKQEQIAEMRKLASSPQAQVHVWNAVAPVLLPTLTSCLRVGLKGDEVKDAKSASYCRIEGGIAPFALSPSLRDYIRTMGDFAEEHSAAAKEVLRLDSLCRAAEPDLELLRYEAMRVARRKKPNEMILRYAIATSKLSSVDLAIRQASAALVEAANSYQERLRSKAVPVIDPEEEKSHELTQET